MTKGVHFDKSKNRWIAKMQKNFIIKRKGFINKDDAIDYRQKLEEEFDTMDTNNNVNVQLTNNSSSGSTVPQNYVRQREHKIIEYHPHHQVFTETNLVTGETKTDRFFVLGFKCEVLHENDYTVVTLDDKFAGKTTCNPNSTYSRKTGLKIAYNLAMIEKLKAEIEELSK